MLAMDWAKDIFTVFGPLGVILVAVIQTLTVRAERKEKRNLAEHASIQDTYKAELEQLHIQREQLFTENAEIRTQLKEELAESRQLRSQLEQQISELKSKVATIEAELFAWRNGLKAPSGYVLVKISPTDLEE